MVISVEVIVYQDVFRQKEGREAQHSGALIFFRWRYECLQQVGDMGGGGIATVRERRSRYIFTYTPTHRSESMSPFVACDERFSLQVNDPPFGINGIKRINASSIEW